MPGLCDHVILVSVTIHDIADAEVHLSRLLDAALAGEEVLLARPGTPLARLVPVTSPAPRHLGFVDLPTAAGRFEPLNHEEMTAWS